MAQDPGHVEHPAQLAVDTFWAMRNEAGRKQVEIGKVDAGERGKVTAGRHMAKLEEIIIEEFVNAGIPRTSIRRKSGIELPGYYRPAKKWDVVVFDQGILVAAIEFKSQVGPSFGNNVNNRSEKPLVPPLTSGAPTKKAPLAESAPGSATSSSSKPPRNPQHP